MYKNPLLLLLHDRHADFLARSAKPVVFGAGAVIRGPQTPSANVIFPETGLVAILTTLEHEVIEVGMVGASGASVPTSLFDTEAVDEAEIAVIDVSGWSMSPTDLAAVLDEDPRLRVAFSRNGEYMLRQARQLAACHAWHPLDQRLATWLLRASEIGRTQAFSSLRSGLLISWAFPMRASRPLLTGF